jgi:hypothetical protein
MFDVTSIATGKKLQVEVTYNDQVTVTINHVHREKLADLIKQATKTTFDRRSHSKEEIFDAINFGELLGVEAIADWTGLESEGKPFPCTDENKRLLMRTWTDFAKFVSDTCTDLETLNEAEQASVRKN